METIETVPVNFALKAGERNMQVGIEVPAGSVTLTGMLPILQNLSNSLVDAAGGAAAERGHPISCRARCTHCCYQLVPVSLFEAEALAGWIRSLPEDAQAALRERFHAALMALHAKGVLERLGSEPPYGEAAKQLIKDYMNAGVPCPFLVDDLCSIHPIRPLVCREYVVVSPPEFCAEPWDLRVLTLVLPFRPSKALSVLGSRISDGAHGLMPLVLLFEWMKLGLEPGKAIAGPGPMVMHEVMSALE